MSKKGTSVTTCDAVHNHQDVLLVFYQLLVDYMNGWVHI